jgi:hypothetical protein
MRNLISIAVVVVLGLVAFNYFQSGELAILPGGAASDDARELNRLRGEFRRAAQDLRQAGRSAGLSGLDTTADVELALNRIEGIERDLRKMRGEVDDAELRGQIDGLLAEIAEYKSEIG